MQVKMAQLLDFTPFFETVKSQKLSFATSYKLTLLAQEINKHLSFYRDQFQEILNRHGEKDAQGNPILTEDGLSFKIIGGQEEAAYAELNELHQVDVELPDYHFTLEDFSAIELSPIEMRVILPFMQVV